MRASRSKLITSKELSKSLDNDYSEDQLKRNIQSHKITCVTKFLRKRDLILVGSKAEGVSNVLESDWDVMSVQTSVICSEKVELLTHDADWCVRLDRTGAPAGYCFLYSPDTDTKLSTLFGIPEHFGSISGPARTISTNDRFTSDCLQDDFHKLLFSIAKTSSYDDVFALPCELPDLQMAWCKRRRNYDWPSQETIRHAATLPAHVVHVGLKGSENQEYQWRICFTLAELHLIQSLNNTQTKVYVCLKRIAKHYLNPIDDDITSYVIKNVVLWLAESMPSEKFKSEFLIDRIEDGLRFLKTSVEVKCLRNYMIPERNLFLNKLENKEPLLEAITKILPLKLYRSEQMMSPEVRTCYNLMCIISKRRPSFFKFMYYEQIRRDYGKRMLTENIKDIELD